MNPWDRYKQKAGANPWERYAGASLEQNPDAQGTYQMVSKEGQNVYVPFGKVLDAGKYGFAITPDDFKRFTKDYTSSLPTRERIDMMLQPSDESTWAGRGLNIVKGTAAGTVGPVLHPVQTAKSAFASSSAILDPYQLAGPEGASPAFERAEDEKARKQVEDQMGEETSKYPYYAVASFAGPAAVFEGIHAAAPEGVKVPGTEYLKGMGERSLERLRAYARDQLGMRQRTEAAVTKFGKDSAAVRAANQAADEATEEARGKVRLNRRVAKENYGKALDEYEKGKTKKKTAFEQEHKDWEDRQQEAIRAHRQAKEETAAANTKALNEHIEAQKADQAAKQSAADELDERKSLEHKLAADQQELFERAQGARPQAEAVNDALWDAWRDSVKGQTVETKPVTEAIAEVQKSHLTAPGDIAEFNKILKETSPTEGEAGQIQTLRDQTAQNVGAKNYASASPAVKKLVDDQIRNVGLSTTAADVPTEADGLRIHVWKQQLERAVRKAENAGNNVVAGAFGRVLDQVRAAENSLTAKGGPNASMLLDMARRQHQNLAEAFRDTDIERNPKTAQNIVIKEHAEDIAKANQKAEALRRMSVHDPEIAAKADEIKATEKRLSELRKPEALQNIIEGPEPQAPVPAELPKYEEFAKKAKVGEEPTEPDYGKAPENPFEQSEEQQYKQGLLYSEPKATKVLPDAAVYFRQNVRYLVDALDRYGRIGPWVFRLIFGSAARAVFKMLEQNASGAEAGYSFAINVTFGQALLTFITNVLSKGNALEGMSRLSDKEVATINELPPADAERLRIALKVLATEDIKKNPEAARIKINPALAAFLGGQPSTWKRENEKQSLKELQSEMEKRNPKKSRSQARTPGVTHVYDPGQGKIVSVQ